MSSASFACVASEQADFCRVVVVVVYIAMHNSTVCFDVDSVMNTVLSNKRATEVQTPHAQRFVKRATTIIFFEALCVDMRFVAQLRTRLFVSLLTKRDLPLWPCSHDRFEHTEHDRLDVANECFEFLFLCCRLWPVAEKVEASSAKKVCFLACWATWLFFHSTRRLFPIFCACFALVSRKKVRDACDRHVKQSVL